MRSIKPMGGGMTSAGALGQARAGLAGLQAKRAGAVKAPPMAPISAVQPLPGTAPVTVPKIGMKAPGTAPISAIQPLPVERTQPMPVLAPRGGLTPVGPPSNMTHNPSMLQATLK